MGCFPDITLVKNHQSFVSCVSVSINNAPGPDKFLYHDFPDRPILRQELIFAAHWFWRENNNISSILDKQIVGFDIVNFRIDGFQSLFDFRKKFPQSRQKWCFSFVCERVQQGQNRGPLHTIVCWC